MINIKGKTHVGRRTNNEDRFVADSGWGVALVADGMGGAEAGEVAAGIVAASVVDRLDVGETLEQAIAAAHGDVVRAVEAGAGAAGMGSTVVIAKFAGYDYQLGWIGDSRAYLWNGELRQLTRDHSHTEERIARGEISPEEAAAEGAGNRITRAMGIEQLDPGDVPSLRGTLGRGQTLLLCSDGLSDALAGPAIAVIMAAPGDAGAKLATLIEAALANGGKDNITVVLASADGDAPQAPPLPPAVAIARADGTRSWSAPGQER